MEAMFILMPLSFLLAFGALLAFWWAVRSGQFSDLSKPSEKLIAEDKLAAIQDHKIK